LIFDKFDFIVAIAIIGGVIWYVRRHIKQIRKI